VSKIFVDQVDPKTATTLTLGTSGDTIDIPSGVTIANSGTATGFGESNTPYFLARLSANQNVSDATATVLVFDEEGLDSGSGYDTSNGKYTIPSGEGGKYYFAVYGEGDGGGAGGLIQVACYIFDGSDEIARGTVNLDSARGDIMTATASTLVTCSAGDEITCKGFVDNVSGSNTRFAGESGINRTYFLGFKVAT
jgi:hypothetical protein